MLWYITTIDSRVHSLHKQGNKDKVIQTNTKENASKSKHCNKSNTFTEMVTMTHMHI